MITRKQALAIYNAGPDAVGKIICDLSARVDAQQRQIDLLLQKVAELERTVAKLSKNSSNSSKPPSSDIIRPKSRKRQKGKRKIGAQHGHERHLRTAGPIRIRVHPRRRTGRRSKPTRPIFVTCLGLICPAPPPKGRRADPAMSSGTRHLTR